MRRLPYLVGFVAVAALLLSIPAFAAGDFGLTVNPGSLNLSAGSNGSYTVAASPSGGFSGSVTVSALVSPASPEVTVSFDRNPLQPYSVAGYAYPDSSTMTVRTTNLALGSYTISVTGTSGSLSHSASVTLQVVAVTTTTTTSKTSTTQPTTGASIVLLSAPTSSSVGDKLTFSWQITGVGSIVHTAVHWGTSPADPTNFMSYPNATPDFGSINPPDQAPKTYTVAFNAPSQSGVVYYVIHAIVGGKNIYLAGGERTIQVSAPQSTTGGQSSNLTLVGAGVVAVILVAAALFLIRRRGAGP